MPTMAVLSIGGTIGVAALCHEVERPHRLPRVQPPIDRKTSVRQRVDPRNHRLVDGLGGHARAAADGCACHAVVRVRGDDELDPRGRRGDEPGGACPDHEHRSERRTKSADGSAGHR
jgi:hypothetical protein